MNEDAEQLPAIKIDLGNFENNIMFLEKVGLLAKEKKILEIGSGSGHLVKELRVRGFDVTGTEVDEKYISLAKEKFGVELIKMSGDKLEFPDKSFDVVISFDVFEHIPDSDRHLQEVKRVLKDDGHYLLQTPNKLTNVISEIVIHKSLTKWKEYHMSVHTYWQLKKRFKKNGFEFRFVEMPTVTEWYKNKVRNYFGAPGVVLLKLVNPNKLPLFMKTNFYLVTKKT